MILRYKMKTQNFCCCVCYRQGDAKTLSSEQDQVCEKEVFLLQHPPAGLVS